MRRLQIKTVGLCAAVLAASTFATAAMAAIIRDFPATYTYYDNNGNIVGERNVGCSPNQQWGVASNTYVLRAGCGFLQ